jgi:signal transduction histidine kinase/HAMP domain-containing protein
MTRLTIRTRLILLSSAALLVLIATNFYLTRKLADNSAGMVTAAELLKSIEEANSAQIAFGEMRYWMTDLAVTQLTMAERSAAAARGRVEQHLDTLAPWNRARIDAVRGELAQYEETANKAVDEYTNDRRVIGNSLLAQARQHSLVVDQLLASIVQELTGAAIAARQRVVAEAATATQVSQIVVTAAVVIGALLTFLVLRSIVLPLRRLVVAMDGLNAGNVAVAIPEAGPDEIGAMARTLGMFRDTLKELRETLAQFEALRGVGRAVGSTLDLQTVLSIVVGRAVEFSRAQAGMIYEYDEVARAFRFRTSHGAEEELTELLKGDPIRLGEGAISTAAVIGSPAQLRDLLSNRELAVPTLWDALARLGYRALIVAPLLHEERILGGLVVARREAGEFSQEIVSLIEAFATQSALAVRNAKLFEEQRQRERDLRAAHDELKAAQASLIHAEKMASLGQLTAGIAHEIKNPLNFVNNFAELSRELLQEVKEIIGSAADRLTDDARLDLDELIATLTGNLSKIAEHGRRADGIVTSMLLHSRGGSGERRETDLNALVEETLNLAFHGARAQDRSFNITLERDLDPSLAPIEIVPQDITRVLLNLFGNGFYAANKRRHEDADPAYQPVLKVTTRDLGDQVEIRVRDNGVGMPPEVRTQLFTPFFTTKPTGEGTGLGLSISYDIVVQQHGGTITVDSNPCEFTEFTLHLPRTLRGADMPAAAARASA